MGVEPENLEEICNLVSRQIEELYPSMETAFIFHTSGMFHEIVETADHTVFKHPSVQIAQNILEKNSGREQSSFLGMAINHELKWMGLASKENLLALFNVNTDDFETPLSARQEIYHLVWHAIDLIEVRKRPEYASKFRSGPMIPKRSPMNLARLNLQADVFSAVMCGLQGEEKALENLAKRRAIDSILPIHLKRAEDYPYVIALEAAQYAYAELLAMKPPRNKYMFYARQLAIEVGRAFDDKSIKDWWGFSEPAQDMAWRKFPQEIILGCAVHTSENPFVRATGHLVSEIANLVPISGLKLGDAYNAFAPSEHNQMLHREIMEKTFEEAASKGMAEESGAPFILAANQQNEDLAEGIILGWCGNALQAAAKAFENALSSGVSPLQAARLEFEGTKDTTSWESLRNVGDAVIEQKRKGYGVTLGNVAEICNNNPLFAPVLGSIRMTIKDPAYIQKLQAANDYNLAHQGPKPSGPAFAAPEPNAPVPQAPTPTPASPTAAPNYYVPAGPSLGGRAGSRLRQHPPLEQTQDKKTTSAEEDRVQ